MSTPARLAYHTVEGPSRMDLMMALFDRKRPDPVKFVGTDNGRRVDIWVWVKGLIQTGENSWKVVGTLTADSPLNPNRYAGTSLRVVCFYNDHTREGSLTDKEWGEEHGGSRCKAAEPETLAPESPRRAGDTWAIGAFEVDPPSGFFQA